MSILSTGLRVQKALRHDPWDVCNAAGGAGALERERGIAVAGMSEPTAQRWRPYRAHLWSELRWNLFSCSGQDDVVERGASTELDCRGFLTGLMQADRHEEGPPP